MNLQPVYPARTAGGSLMYFRCSNCSKECDSNTSFADLAAQRGTYYCASCTGAFFLTNNAMRNALIERDRRELRTKQ